MFESGAILLYMAERYGGLDTPERRASAAQWVLFANSTYSSVAFSANQRAQQLPALCDSLNAVLSKSKYLLGDTFSVADVAMGAYLAYTCMFFADVSFRVRALKYVAEVMKPLTPLSPLRRNGPPLPSTWRTLRSAPRLRQPSARSDGRGVNALF